MALYFVKLLSRSMALSCLFCFQIKKKRRKIKRCSATTIALHFQELFLKGHETIEYMMCKQVISLILVKWHDIVHTTDRKKKKKKKGVGALLSWDIL